MSGCLGQTGWIGSRGSGVGGLVQHDELLGQMYDVELGYMSAQVEVSSHWIEGGG